MKKNEVFIHAIHGISLKHYIVSEKSQSQDHTVCFQLNEMSRIQKSMGIERLVVARGLGGVGMGSTCKWVQGFFLGD